MLRFTIALMMMAFLQEDCEPKTEFQSTGAYGRATGLTVDTPDGRRVTCIVWNFGESGGLSCDWVNAKLINVEVPPK